LTALFSFLICAFGQAAWVGALAPLAASFGYALFFLKRPSFWAAVLFFAAVQAVQLSWMATPAYMGPLIYFVWGGLIFAMGLQFGCLTLLVNRGVGPAAVAGFWVLMEASRLFLLTGFSWNPVGMALAAQNLSLQAASLFGIFGLSFWVIYVNLFALRAMLERGRSIGVWALLALIPYAYGALRSGQEPSGSLRALLVQTALLPEERDYTASAPERYVPIQEQWRRIVDQVREKKGDLIVLPEAALPYGAHLPFGPGHRFDELFPELKGNEVTNSRIAAALSRATGADVILGLDDRDEQGRRYNAAFHFTKEGGEQGRYEKRILVPVGEYVPFQRLQSIARFIASEFGIAASFDPGQQAKIFRGKVPIGISICYEETFGSMMREVASLGPEVLVNLTNDAWFPDSKLPLQHFEHGRVRSVELGLPALRCCNTGVTAAIDPFGRVIAALPAKESGIEVLEVDLPLVLVPTLYRYAGDWPILLLSLASLFYCLKTAVSARFSGKSPLQEE
jgi:apolipoprotein N-acyltransferase